MASRVVSVRLDSDLVDRLEKRAKVQGCTVSDLIRAQVCDGVSPMPSVFFSPLVCVCSPDTRAWPSIGSFAIFGGVQGDPTMTGPTLKAHCGTCLGPLPSGWALTLDASS